MHRLLRFAEKLFLGLGIAALLYTVGVLAYGEVLQRYWQSGFESRRAMPEPALDSLKASLEDVVEGHVDDLSELELYPEAPRAVLERGDQVAQLEIPRLGISLGVFHGVETENLLLGAGHVPGTPLPGGGGNTAIAAHRDTFFRRLEAIQPDDLIHVSMPDGDYDYTVDSIEIVGPDETRVLESRARPELTLITCYPFRYIGPAPERFIVHASPVSLKGE